MKAKRLLIAGLTAVCAVTAACALAACNDNDDDDKNKQSEITAEKICTGIFDTPVINDPSGRHNFVSFHEDGIFYHSMYGGNMSEAGYWKLVKEDFTFNLFDDYTTKGLTDDQKHWTATTASAYVELTNFDGTAYETTKDADKDDTNVATNKYAIYDDGTNGLAVYGVWYSNTRYIWDENSTHKSSDETAVQVCKYVLATDASYSVTINHNGAVVELDGDFDDAATWTYNSSTRTYTITKDGGTATLVVAADGNSATYKAGTVETELVDPDSLGEKSFLDIGEDSGTFTLSFYADGSYTVGASYGGVTQTMKTGVWSYDNYGVTLDSGSAVYPDQTARTYTFVISLTTSQGATDYNFTVSAADAMPLFIANSTPATPAEPEEVCSVKDTSTTFTITFYDNKTYKVTASFGGQTQEMKSGTWEFNMPGLTLDDSETPLYPNAETREFAITVSLTTSQGTNDFTFNVAASNFAAFV